MKNNCYLCNWYLFSKCRRMTFSFLEYLFSFERYLHFACKLGRIKQVRETGRYKKKPFLFLKNDSGIFSRQLSETKETQNWSCFVSNLTNSINKMFVILIYLKNSTFLSLEIIVYTGIVNETSNHHFLKSVKIKT